MERTTIESRERLVVVDLPFEGALADFVEALHKENVDVVGGFDVREYLARSLPHDFRRYVVIEAASADVTFEALQLDLEIGVKLPATIAVFELADGETAFVVSEPFGGLASNWAWRRQSPAMAVLADRVCERIARAIDHVRRDGRYGTTAKRSSTCLTPGAAQAARSAS